MSVTIDPLSSVDPAAKLGAGVVIGPFCRVGPGVILEDGVTLVSHVVVDGETVIGARTTVEPFACLGLPPQDRKYAGEPTRLVIGADCHLREYVNCHRGTAAGGGETRVEDGALLMVGVHIGHDCQVGPGATFANHVTLGGHVTVGRQVFIGGLSAVHQHVRIGDYAYIGGVSPVRKDVVPHGIVSGADSHLIGLNLVGMKRRGVPREDINVLRAVYRTVFHAPGTLRERVAAAEAAWGGHPAAREILDFIREDAARELTQEAPRSRNGA